MNMYFPSTFSSSMMDHGMFSCYRKWFNRYCLKLSTGKNNDLESGGLFASALENTRKAYFNESLDPEDAVNIGYEHILSSPAINDPVKNNDNLALAFKRYFKTFPLETSNKPCELADGSFAIEYYFKFDTGIPHPDRPAINIMIVGKLDFLGERTNHKGEVERFVHDDKTTKSVYRVPGTKYIDKEKETDSYRTRGQFILYNWAAKKLNINTVGTIVHRIPLMKEQEKPFELSVPCNDFMIDSLEKAFFGKIVDLRERYIAVKKGLDYRSAFGSSYNNACVSFGRQCPYTVGCLEPKGASALEAMYEQVIGYPEIPEGTMPLEEFLKKLDNGEIQ